MAGRKERPQVALGRDDRLMTWSSNLNIYRVNRFHPFDLSSYEKSKAKAEALIASKFDIIEALLMRNMVEAAEKIFYYVGLESSRDCVMVCKLWYEFLSCHLFKRWAEQLVNGDESLQELAEAEHWNTHLEAEVDQIEDFLIYRKICYRIFGLREVWRYREPKLRRLQCESFVLSLKFVEDELFCGLNNGCLQLWDLEWTSKKREEEIHDKGVKCIDMNEKIICTGSISASGVPFKF